MRPWVNAALMLVVLCAGAVLHRNASAADPEDFLEGRLAEVERKLRFHEWAGHVKIPGKQLTRLDFAPTDFKGFAHVAFLRRLPREADLHVFPADVRKGSSITVSIRLNDSALEAQRSILRGFAMRTSPSETWKDTRAERGSAYDVGDVCFPSPLPVDIRFTRNNTFVRAQGSEKNDPADVLRLAKQIDAKLVESLVEIGAKLPAGKMEEPTRPAPPGLPRELVAAIEQNDLDRLLSFVRRPERELRRAAIDALAKTPEGRAALAGLVKEVRGADRYTVISALGRAGTPDALDALRKMAETAQEPQLYEEAMEALLKGMPEHEGRQFCLEEAEKLADNPDAQPDKLLFLIRGLRRDEDPPEVRALRQILRKTNNERVREVCLTTLCKWVTDAAETREDVLRILEGHLKDESAGVRVAVVRALGESGDPRYVAVIARALDDAHAGVRQQGAEAICTLLGWKRPKLSSDQQLDAWLEGLKAALPPVLEALGQLEKATKQPGLW